MKVIVTSMVLVLLGLVPLSLGQYARPAFTETTYIPYETVTKAFWGESDETGYASDLIYVSNQKIHVLLFQMPPGAFYRSSPTNRVVYGADEVWHVLGGTLAINNPENGEMQVVNRGEAVFFRKDTWHHGFSVGSEPLVVLEHFAPPPLAGTTGDYSNSRPFLETFREGQDEWIGNWPMERKKAESEFTMEVIGDRDLLWRLEGEALVGVYASTEHLTSAKLILMPGQKSSPRQHGGDSCVYLVEGDTLDVITTSDSGERQSYILRPKDGLFVPEGTNHQFFNMSNQKTVLLVGVAPRYFPE